MVFRRNAYAAALIAALHPIGELRSEPLERAAANGPEPAVEAAVVPTEGHYRSGISGWRPVGERAAFSLTSTVRPAVAPGTTAWLGRGVSGEPLATSSAAPHPGRKEFGFSYSSDGRVYAYVAERERPAGIDELHAAGVDCCAAAPATHGKYAKGGEGPAVASLVSRLKTRGLKLALDDGWKLNAGARSREYANSAHKSRVAHITLQRWWGNLSTGYAMQLEKRGGWDVAPSQSLQLGYALAPRSTLGVAYTTGQEFAFFGAQGMLKTEVRSFTLQGEHAVTKNWSLRFDAGYYDHGDLPAHRAIRVALRLTL